ncbi:MAG TPA: MarC family protein [Caulobacteraceae bacterium]|jgi:multiple antibiotic resistance protein
MGPAQEFGVNFFVALFALLDPIGNVPVFAAATLGASAGGRRLTAVYISLFAFVFLIFFYFAGLSLLQFFGISMPAFRIAGGILLLLLGLDMARNDITEAFAASGDTQGVNDIRGYARRSFERLVVPFAMPLLIGPGAMSAVIIYAGEAKAFGVTGAAVGAAVIFGVCVATLVTFLLTGLMSRLFGRVGMTIVVRVAGLILCAMAIQFILTGVNDSTRGLIKRDVAQPYADAKH